MINVPSWVENEQAYIDAAMRRIAENARKGRQQRWFKADPTREALALEIRDRAYEKPFGFFGKMEKALDEYGSLTENQEAACRRIIEQEKQRKAEMRARDAGSEFVGELKQRREWTLSVNGTFEYETDFGMTYGYICKDEAGNVILIKSTKPLEMQKGMSYRVKATVKAHTEREGIKQTVLNRVAIL